MTIIVDGAPVAVVPRSPDPDMLQDGYDAAKAVRVSSVSGMTIDAQLRAQTARQAATYSAMIAAAPPEPLAAILEMRDLLEDVLSVLPVDDREKARAILARVTTEETSDAG